MSSVRPSELGMNSNPRVVEKYYSTAGQWHAERYRDRKIDTEELKRGLKGTRIRKKARLCLDCKGAVTGNFHRCPECHQKHRDQKYAQYTTAKAIAKAMAETSKEIQHGSRSDVRVHGHQ